MKAMNLLRRTRILNINNNTHYNANCYISQRFNSTTYGFIGLGQMGRGMANNLINKTKESGSLVYVYDTYEPSLTDAINNGAIPASSPSELGPNCDFIITMLRSDEQVNDVYGQILSKSLKDGAVLIDSSTVSHLTSKDLAKQLPSNASIIDAPVSGGIVAAKDGKLTFMCGGKESAFNKAKPVLETMGINVFHCGIDNGSGQIAKICNNLILAISMCAVSEGMNLGVKLGMDPQKLANIVNVSSGRCWSSDQYNPCPGVTLYDEKGNEKSIPSKNNYNGGFVVDLMRKDLGLALDAAKGKDINANTPLAASVSQIYDMIAKRGFGDKDFGFIYQFIKGAENEENLKSYGA